MSNKYQQEFIMKAIAIVSVIFVFSVLLILVASKMPRVNDNNVDPEKIKEAVTEDVIFTYNLDRDPTLINPKLYEFECTGDAKCKIIQQACTKANTFHTESCQSDLAYLIASNKMTTNIQDEKDKSEYIVHGMAKSQEVYETITDLELHEAAVSDAKTASATTTTKRPEDIVKIRVDHKPTLDYITVISKVDDLSIDDFKINNGRCEVDTRNFNFGVPMNIGQAMQFISLDGKCTGKDLKEITIYSNKGELTFEPNK